MAKQRQVAFPKRGEIYLVNFDPTVVNLNINIFQTIKGVA